MSQQSINTMKKISLNKIVLNMGLGQSGEIIEIASNALNQITKRKPSPRNAKKSQRDWGVRKGEPIGVIVTVRGKDATILLKRLFQGVNNQIKEKSFDNEGNVSFGIKEHIDIPDVKYDPTIGIFRLLRNLILNPGLVRDAATSKPKIPILGSYFTSGISICSLIPNDTLPSSSKDFSLI